MIREREEIGVWKRSPEDPAVTLAVTAVVIAFNVHLFIKIPKGFFPQQDTGQINGGIRADQSISFQAMQRKLIDRVVSHELGGAYQEAHAKALEALDGKRYFRLLDALEAMITAPPLSPLRDPVELAAAAAVGDAA